MANAKSKFYRRHIGIAYCDSCGDIMISKGGGIFINCPCGKSFIDQERYDARYVRLGGNAKFIEQICPSACKIKEHRKNDKNNSTSSLKPNIKKKRQVGKVKRRNKRT